MLCPPRLRPSPTLGDPVARRRHEMRGALDVFLQQHLVAVGQVDRHRAPEHSLSVDAASGDAPFPGRHQQHAAGLGPSRAGAVRGPCLGAARVVA